MRPALVPAGNLARSLPCEPHSAYNHGELQQSGSSGNSTGAEGGMARKAKAPGMSASQPSLATVKVADFSDPVFLIRLKNRDEAALAALVDTYLPQLLRAGRGMGFSPEDCDDLAQTALTALIEGLDRFEGRSHVRTFLFGIFYNKVSERLREKHKEQEHDSLDEVFESRFDASGRWRQPPVDVEKEIFAQEVRRIIRDCLETIPRAQRVAFYLREVEEMKTPEICKKIGITATNLGVLLFRARNRLRECVEKKGIKRN